MLLNFGLMGGGGLEQMTKNLECKEWLGCKKENLKQNFKKHGG